jgi:hypothetical protein
MEPAMVIGAKLFSLMFLVMATTTAGCTNVLPVWAQRAGGACGGDPEPPQLMGHDVTCHRRQGPRLDLGLGHPLGPH